MKCKCGGKLTSCDQVHTPDNRTLRKRRCMECGNFTYTVEYAIKYNDKAKYLWNTNHRMTKKRMEGEGEL